MGSRGASIGRRKAGTVFVPKGYKTTEHQDEIQAAKWIAKEIGGKIHLLNESDKQFVKTADYLWDGKLWELKRVTSKTSADQQLRKAAKQIYSNPGGVIILLGGKKNADALVSEIIEKAPKRLPKGSEVIIKKGDRLIKRFRA